MHNPPTAPLEVRGLSKNYELHATPGQRFARQLLGRFSPFRGQSFAALQDVSFDLNRGEALAVLGRNGAGKSTLLQLITGLLQPSSGSVHVPARVVGLLELGSGFNPDFTGRENIWINAAILGLSHAQTRDRMDDIISFADIGDYIDEPVRTYSSGMFLRLAFGVATAVSPDLLLVDEVLAVGDIFFRQKCYDRLRAMREAGTAVVLVTHSLTDASEFCDRGLVLSEGAMVFAGGGTEAVEYYMHHEREARTGVRTAGPKAPRPTPVENAPGLDWVDQPATVDLTAFPQVGGKTAATVERLLITDLHGRPTRVFRQGAWMRMKVAFEAHTEVERAVAGMMLRNERNVSVHGKNSLNVADASPHNVAAHTRIELAYDVKLDLALGEYTLDVALAGVSDAAYSHRATLSPDEIGSYLTLLERVNGAAAISVIARRDGPASFSHYGVADLPGTLTVRAQPLP